jgi:hypothetical protein
MSDLLRLAISAHGGLARWRELSSVIVRASAGGTLFSLKGYPTALSTATTLSADTRRPHLTCTPFLSADQGVWSPDNVTIRSRDGVTSRDNPRSASLAVPFGQQWDPAHLMYFVGYALWNYLVTPFLFTWAGFDVHEVEPWSEDGEKWRRLHVTYPELIPAHCRQQVLYFDDGGLLRRLDYCADVLESASAVHYCDNYRDFDGIMIATRRRAYRRLDDNRPDKRLRFIEVDISDAECR